MDQVTFYVGLIALLLVIIFFVIILERQAKKNNEMITFLAGRFTDMGKAQDDRHQIQIDSLIAMNLSQADRHQKQTDSLLGLIDEMSSRTNPEKLTFQQYKAYEQYLIDQAKDIR